MPNGRTTLNGYDGSHVIAMPVNALGYADDLDPATSVDAVIAWTILARYHSDARIDSQINQGCGKRTGKICKSLDDMGPRIGMGSDEVDHQRTFIIDRKLAAGTSLHRRKTMGPHGGGSLGVTLQHGIPRGKGRNRPRAVDTQQPRAAAAEIEQRLPDPFTVLLRRCGRHQVARPLL